MAKIIHVMLRASDLEKSIQFYADVLDMKVRDRFDFADFTLAYLGNQESSFEIELTHNKNRSANYSLGDGYGHIAVTVENLEKKHANLLINGFAVDPIKTLSHEGKLLAKFFFATDPDGYRIEFIEKMGRY